MSIISYDLALYIACVLNVILPKPYLLWLYERQEMARCGDDFIILIKLIGCQGLFEGFFVGFRVILVIKQSGLCLWVIGKLMLNEGFEASIGIFDNLAGSIFDAGNGTGGHCAKDEIGRFHIHNTTS